MTHAVTVLYSRSDDPFINNLPGDADVRLVPLDDLLEYFEPVPWPMVLRANFPDEIIRNFDGKYVVNRIFTLEGSQTADRLREWGVDERWLHIRLMELLGRARKLAHDIGVRGVSRCLLPLNTQWFRIGQAAIHSAVGTPNFAYGVSYEAPPDLDALKEPMQKSVWSIFDWREEKHMSDGERSRNRFYVEKPIGTPVVVHYYGDFHFCHFPRESIAVDEALLADIVAACRRTFASEFGEILLYKEADGQLRFYSFSPYLLSAAMDTRFKGSVKRWIEDVEVEHG